MVRGCDAEFDEAALASFADHASSSGVHRVGTGGGLVELVFEHESDDLWTALLATMNASWASGRDPVAVTARSVGHDAPED